MDFPDAWWNISMLSLEILAASVLRYHADKQTDRQMPMKTQHHNCRWLGNDVARLGSDVF